MTRQRDERPQFRQVPHLGVPDRIDEDVDSDWSEDFDQKYADQSVHVASRSGTASDEAGADADEPVPHRQQSHLIWRRRRGGSARARQSTVGRIVIAAMMLSALAIALVSTFVLFGYELTGLTMLLLPVVAGADTYTAVKLHAVLVLGLTPLLFFTSIRRDAYYREIGLLFSAICALILLVFLAKENLSSQTPAGTWVFVGLLALQTLFAPYLLFSRRASASFKRPGSGYEAISTQVPAHKSPEPPTQPQPQPQPQAKPQEQMAGNTDGDASTPRTHDLMVYVKQCPRCSELIRRTATECRHCGFRYSPELLEKERQIFASRGYGHDVGGSDDAGTEEELT